MVRLLVGGAVDVVEVEIFVIVLLLVVVDVVINGMTLTLSTVELIDEPSLLIAFTVIK